MYYRFFGLNRAPFKITPDTSLFYSGAKRGAVLDALVYAVLNGEGIIKVVGEVGSGKTMLCRMLEVRLPRHVDVVYINNPSLSPDNILQVVAYELAVVEDPCTPKLEAMQRLNNYLIKRHSEGAQVVVFLEEAQGMPLATLEEVRLLSNLETEQSKLMQLVMFGQPELDETLRDPSIRQLRERITHSFDLEPLKEDEIMEYLNFRLWVAGYRGAELFTPKVVKRIAKYSLGLIRRMNILADKTLLAAYSDNTYQLLPKHVDMAAIDSQYRRPKAPLPKWAKPALGVAALLAVSLLAHTLIQSPREAWSQLSQGSQQMWQQAQQRLQQWWLADENGVAAQAKTEAEVVVVPSVARVHHSASDRPALDAYLAQTEAWMQRNTEQQYSLRLIEVDAAQSAQVQNLISELPSNFSRDALYLLRHEEFDVTRLTLVYSEFDTVAQAEQVIEQLPDALRQWGPDVQTVRALRSLLRK